METTAAPETEEEGIRACCRAAVEKATELGLDPARPEVLATSSNVVVGLSDQLVARVGFRIARLWGDRGRRRLTHELELASWLAERGAPVVPPWKEIPVELYEHDGRLITFWERAHNDGPSLRFSDGARLLHRLHSEVRDYPGEMEPLVPISEYIPRLVDELERTAAVEQGSIELMRSAFDRLHSEIEQLGLPHVPLHGDPHLGNIMHQGTGDDALFIDFEDCCEGPIHWDVASMAGASPRALEAVVAAYGDPIEPAEIAPFTQVRTLQGAAWLALRARDEPRWKSRRDIIFKELAKNEGRASG